MRGHAFGLDVSARFSIPELPAGSAHGGGPLSSLEPASAGELERAWPAEDVQRLLERTLPDGRPFMVVEHHRDVGYHVWAPRYGRHLVSPDGTQVRCALPRVPAWRWERLLFAQVLPLAAALHGRELFHASAVSLDGAAIAFVGFPGAGKSSIAAHLVAGGRSLVTDDVLALERSDGGIVAHPGTSLAGVDPRELAAMSARGRARLGKRVGRSDKIYLAAHVVKGPLPLRGLYFIDRGRSGPVSIAPAEAIPQRLLGSSFIAYLRLPRTLVEHLDVCARIADAVPTFEVAVPRSVQAREVALAIESHAGYLVEARG